MVAAPTRICCLAPSVYGAVQSARIVLEATSASPRPAAGHRVAAQPAPPSLLRPPARRSTQQVGRARTCVVPVPVGTLLLGTTVAGKTVWEQRDEILLWLTSIQQQLGFGSETGTTQAASATPARTRSFLREPAVSRVSTVPAPQRTGQSASGVAPARRAADMAPARVADTARPAAVRWTVALASPAAVPAVSRQKSMVSAPASPVGASSSAVPVPAAAGGAFAW